MSKKKVLVVAALLVAGGTAIAVSAPGQRMYGHMSDRWSHSEGSGLGMSPLHGRWSGSLTREAYDERVRERFARFDANSDGIIDIAEIEAALAKGGKHRHGHHRHGAREDAENKGDVRRGRSVTKSEFLDNVRRRFGMIDLDSDGKITDADLPPNLRGRGILSSEQGMRGHGRGARMLSFLRGADTDKDGAISLDEALKVAGARFDRMDRTKDGTLDSADRDAFAKEMTDYRVKRVLHRFGATAEGKITRDQAFKVAGDMFTRLDRNKDGTITRDERPRWGGHGGGHERRMWRGRDRDHGEPSAPTPEQKKI